RRKAAGDFSVCLPVQGLLYGTWHSEVRRARLRREVCRSLSPCRGRASPAAGVAPGSKPGRAGERGARANGEESDLQSCDGDRIAVRPLGEMEDRQGVVGDG